MKTKYEIGEQPCDEFNPDRDWTYMINVHECYITDGCEGTVSFCLNCCNDHHSGGWETCGNKVPKE